MKSKKLTLFIIGMLLVLLIFTGVSYSFYKSNVEKINETVTNLKTNELDLVYTGIEEISFPTMVPGETYIKNFTVENKSNKELNYNIYMENVTNEFSDDLVYKIVETDNSGNDLDTVVDEAKLPNTKIGKSYLKVNIPIEASPKIQYYKLIVEYKYLEDQKQDLSQGVSFFGTVGIDTKEDAEEAGVHTLTINPNGGIYNNSDKKTKIKMENGDEYEIGIPTRSDAYEFVGWTINEQPLSGNTITMENNSIEVIANWRVSDNVVAKINDTYYSTIQNAINDANTDDLIEILKDTEETYANNKTLRIDYGGFTVEGKLVNTGNITIDHGNLLNSSNIAIDNSGTLNIGYNDGNVSTTSIKITGEINGIKDTGILNFYDGKVEGKIAINGVLDATPDGYFAFVDHDNVRDYQVEYLIESTTRAVAKTTQGSDVLYFNLQDAINTASINELDITIIRNFEAAYTLTINNNANAIIDLDGYTIDTGYSITNNGNLTIKDTKKTGEINQSVAITNNGNLTIKDIDITQTTSDNVVINSGNATLSNTTLTALGGYALDIRANGTVTLDSKTYLKANGYAVYNESTSEVTLSGGHIEGLRNNGILKIIDGDYKSGPNDYAVYNEKTLTVEDISINDEKGGIHNKKDLVINDATITTTKDSIHNESNLTINDGNYSSNTGSGLFNTNKTIINNGTFTSQTLAGITNQGSSANLTVNNGTFTGNVGIDNDLYSWYGSTWHYNCGKVYIKGGTIEGTTAGVEQCYADGKKEELEITGGTIIGGTYGLYKQGNATIKGGTITGETYGIYNISSSDLIIGENNETLDITTPVIKGGTHGLYIKNGNVSLYDGVLMGTVKGIEGIVYEIPDAMEITTSNETINNVEYEKAYLKGQENFLLLNGKEYNSLKTAIGKIQTTGEIQMFKTPDTQKVAIEIPAGKDITFDLNGCTYDTAQSITNKGTLTIKDSKTNGTIRTDSKIVLINNEKDLNILKGKLVNTNANNNMYVIKNTNTGVVDITTAEIESGYDAIFSEGTFTMNGGNVTSNRASLINKKTMTLKNVTATSTTNYGVDSNSTLTLENVTLKGIYGLNVTGGNVTITSGTFTGTSNYGIYLYSSTTNITNANVTSETNTAMYIGGTANVENITVTSPANKEAINMANGTLNLKNGTVIGGTYGIKLASDSKVTLGDAETSVDTTKPVIQGGTSSINNVTFNKGYLKFYDGILKGKTAAYQVTISEIPDATSVINDTEMIDSVEYKTAYLKEQDNFVEVNGTEYNSLKKAISVIQKAGNTGTMTLTATPEVQKVPVEIPEGMNITFDLNDNTYQTTQPITNNGTFTIKDGKTTGTISTTEAISMLINNSNMTIESGNFSISSTNGNDYANIVTNNGTLVLTNPNMQSKNWTIINKENGNITFNGGVYDSISRTVMQNLGEATINNNTKITAQDNNGIENRKKLTINNGEISSKSGIYEYNSNSEITVNGGTIIGKNGIGINGGGKITVKGGNVKSLTTTGIYASGTFTVEGGVIESPKNAIETYNGTTKILGGEVTGGVYGVYNNAPSSKIIIGSNEDSLDTTSPVIKGESYGIYTIAFNANGYLYFYDGIIKGIVDATNIGYSNVLENSQVKVDTETIDDNTYITNTLETEDWLVNNGMTDFKNLQTAITESPDGSTLTLKRNASIYYPITNSKNITIDMVGYSLTMSKGITNSGTLTIKDSTNSGNSKIKETHLYNTVTNSKTLNLSNISFENSLTDRYQIYNNGTNGVVTITNCSFDGKKGIESTNELILENVNTNVTDTAIRNTGALTATGGNIYGKSYAISDYSTKDSTFTDVILKSDSSSFYKSSNSNIMIDNSNTTDSIVGNITYYATMKFDITNIKLNGSINNSRSGIVTIDSSELNGTINNSGTLNLKDSSDIYEHKSGNITLVTNTGTLNLDNSTLKIKKESSNTSNELTTLYNTGTVVVDDSDIIKNDTSIMNTKHYAIRNNNSGNITINSGNVISTGGKISYGIYNENASSKVTIKSGNIDVSNARNAYGIYANKGEVVLGEYDGSGLPNVPKQNDPYVIGVGIDTGIGVKKIDGLFKYYDGVIVGSTEAKPESTTEVEYKYETTFELYEGTGYQKCYLEYLEGPSLIIKQELGEDKDVIVRYFSTNSMNCTIGENESCTKTIKIDNTSNKLKSFDMYITNLSSGFDSTNLVYTVKDTNGNVIIENKSLGNGDTIKLLEDQNINWNYSEKYIIEIENTGNTSKTFDCDFGVQLVDPNLTFDMTGVNWYFDNSNLVSGSKVWENKVLGNADFTINEGVTISDGNLFLTGKANNNLKLEKYDNITIYVVAKALDNANIIMTGNGSTASPLAGIAANTDHDITFTHYVNQTHYTSTTNATKYNVISISYDSINNVSKYFINGELVYTDINNGYYEPNYWLGNYGRYTANRNIYYKMVAIANEKHDDNTIIANQKYLINTYGID
ncbi:MAG: hypothetical protein E7158_02725 [Firmicutes bacterium]|nr:hypothetical protein [Bacillota bacterium]